MSLITCNQISIGYEGVSVIDNLSFKINQGDYLCIVGENGSGKSTLMKGLLGLLSTQKGSILYSDGLMQNQIGYLPQQSSAQRNFPASVYEIVLSGTLNNAKSFFYSKEQKNTAVLNMKKTSIADLKKRCYRELSGGQQQRVMLARALCATKKLLLLDEPVTGLDPIASNDMYNLISELNKSGITIIMVSHDITASIKHASHILHLCKDTYFYGTTHQYVHSEIGSRFLITDCPCNQCKHNHSSFSYREENKNDI